MTMQVPHKATLAARGMKPLMNPAMPCSRKIWRVRDNALILLLPYRQRLSNRIREMSNLSLR